MQGMDVVDSIANVQTSQAPQKDRPVVDVVMNTVEIIRNGREAKKFDAVQIMTDYFAAEEKRLAWRKGLKTTPPHAPKPLAKLQETPLTSDCFEIGR